MTAEISLDKVPRRTAGRVFLDGDCASQRHPTYAGGLGVLAGDTLRAAADLRLPSRWRDLVSRAGYFRQEIDARGSQVERPATWNPSDRASPLDAKAAVRIEDRPVWIGAWLYEVRSGTGVTAPVILLDTDLPENRPEDREITHCLYGGTSRTVSSRRWCSAWAACACCTPPASR